MRDRRAGLQRLFDVGLRRFPLRNAGFGKPEAAFGHAAGRELKITSYKFQKEYRPWKGFIIGAFCLGIFVLIGSIIFGCNQTEMMRAAASEDVSLSGGLTARRPHFQLSRRLGRWFPFVTLNNAGTYVSYFLASLLILLPIGRFGRAVYRGRVRAQKQNSPASRKLRRAQAAGRTE